MIDIIRRLVAATGPDRELDAEIAIAFGWERCGQFPSGEHYWRDPKMQFRPQPPRYTESLDATLTLVPKIFRWMIEQHADFRFRATVGDNVTGGGCGVSNMPAIAFLIAILRAKESGE